MKTNNKTALITGARSGIGFGAAKAFLEKGWNVVLNSRNAEKLAAAAEDLGEPSRIAVVAGDISHRETGERMVETAVQRFGSVDVLVNNAGSFVPKPFVDVTEEELDSYLDGTLKGTYITTQAVARQMKLQGGGAIVNIGTVQVNHALQGLPATAPLAAKGGIHALTIGLASELAEYKIRVNLVAPGVIRTPIYGDANVDAFAGVHLLNRVGEVKDTTEAILYLATADFVTGVILPVDGGYLSGMPAPAQEKQATKV